MLEENEYRLKLSHYDTLASMVFVSSITIISIVTSFAAINGGLLDSAFVYFLAGLIIFLNISAVLSLGGILVAKIDGIEEKKNLTLASAVMVLTGIVVLSLGFFLVLIPTQLGTILVMAVYLLLLVSALSKTRLREASGKVGKLFRRKE